MRIKHQHLFRTLSSDPNRFRDFVSQADTKAWPCSSMSAWNAVPRS